MRFLHVKGTYSEIGKAIGKAQKKEIISLLGSIIIKEEIKAISEKALIRHKKAFPEFVQELEGIANGAGVDFLSLFAFNCFEDRISFKSHEEKCTTIFWPDKKGGFIGHNEEEFGFNYGKLLLVQADVADKGSFLSLNYPGILCGDSISINSHGMIHTIDTIYPLKITRNGYARSFIGRALLESSSLKQTKQVLAKFPNFEGLYILAYSKNEKKCIGIETYGNKISVMNLKEIRVVTDAGTSLDIKCGRYKWANCNGRIKPDIKDDNYPEGEVFTCPEDINGVLVVDGVLGDVYDAKYGVITKTPLVLRIEKGYAKENGFYCCNKDLQDDIFHYLFSGHSFSSRVGEVALGTNICLERIIGNLLQDEKYPSFHLAFGYPYPVDTGAEWTCPKHIDMVVLKPDVYVDGNLIMEKGKYKI